MQAKGALMRVVLQRALSANVTVDDVVLGAIDKGFVLLVGITHTDTLKDVQYLAEKIANLRIFEDEAGKMNLSILDLQANDKQVAESLGILSVSQFTLYGDCRKGRRPGFSDAARPDVAEPLYDAFNATLRGYGLQVETGQFGADMRVNLTNWGPVTLILDSPPT
jgi:D-tyrosyl-tRNA(Tyr) deacylase